MSGKRAARQAPLQRSLQSGLFKPVRRVADAEL